MRVAVVKLGARISFNSRDTSGGNGEARSIIKMLHRGGAEVHIFTKILDKDTLPSEYKWHDIEKDAETIDHSPCEGLVVLNGNVNFFGGAEDRSQLLNYHIINNFRGPVFYVYCDPALTLKQVWPSVEKKKWVSNWQRKNLEITRDDIIYFSQPADVKKVAKILEKIDIGVREIIHYPFEKFPCLNERLPLNTAPKIDLSYGGTMRGGKRAEKMLKYYFGHNAISVEMFGKIELEDFQKIPKIASKMNGSGLSWPNFSGPVRYDEMLPKMNEAMAHVVIGDPLYEDINDMAQRAYESIWSSVITFIDADLDGWRRVYAADRVLGDFLYVNDRHEVREKIQLLKADEPLRRQIVEDQVRAVNFNADEYCGTFVQALRELA